MNTNHRKWNSLTTRWAGKVKTPEFLCQTFSFSNSIAVKECGCRSGPSPSEAFEVAGSSHVYVRPCNVLHTYGIKARRAAHLRDQGEACCTLTGSRRDVLHTYGIKARRLSARGHPTFTSPCNVLHTYGIKARRLRAPPCNVLYTYGNKARPLRVRGHPTFTSPCNVLYTYGIKATIRSSHVKCFFIPLSP